MIDLTDRIEMRIEKLRIEQEQFVQTAPFRAEERLQAYRAQLQMEIDLRMHFFEQQIAQLMDLLTPPEPKD